MAEYIEKEALYKKIAEIEELARNRYLDTPSNSPACARYMAQLGERTRFKHLIADFPAVDVAPVVHGRWEHDEMYEDWADQYLCSVCKCHALTNGDYMHKLSVYCPSCGARMDLDTADDVQSIYKSALNKWGKEN